MSRSGKRLSTSQKNANRKRRKKARSKIIKCSKPQMPSLAYRELYIIIKDYIIRFLKDNKRVGENISYRVKATCGVAVEVYSIVALVSSHHEFVIHSMEFIDEQIKVRMVIRNRLISNFVVSNSSVGVYHRIISDPKMIDGLDTFLATGLERFRRLSNEYVGGGNS